MSIEAFRTGFIAIVGRPNVGKSTLMNRLIGQKISITSRKAQTTRHRITGIHTDAHTQFIFVDTPGFQTQHQNALNRVMNKSVTHALKEVDVVLFLIEGTRFDERDRKVIPLLPADRPVLLVINKVDRLEDKNSMLPFIQEMAKEYNFAAIVPVSAKQGTQMDVLLDAIRAHLPEGAPMFGEDEVTDRSERFLASEIIREKIFRLLGEEVPYSVSVMIEKFEMDGTMRRIHAAILVDKANQKAIIIGKGGEKLKEISTQARKDMEKLFDGKVFLETWVKVKGGWADDERALKSLGYD
jgi:GTP-binding protein Era